MIRIKILLTALNSKYIHSSLALRGLLSYCEEYRENLVLKEFTINNSEDFILRQIYKEKPDVVCFSCYIWNIEIIKAICVNLKKIMKDLIIILGGPEVSYEIEFEKLNCDIIVAGEGEKPFKTLVHNLINKKDLKKVKGIVYKENNEIIHNEEGEIVSLDEIPFAYSELTELKNRIIYYESSRGCPFNCEYCLSSVEKGVRFLSEKRVKSDLKFFLKNYSRQVKFVDRTFNCNKKHAILIWKYIIEHDNFHTNFHFEISADLLDDEMLKILKKARAGLIQLEIGIQSTNHETLDEIKRKTDLDELFKKVKIINGFDNIHQHVDLIVGLPKEGYESFKKSFNDAYELKADMLQIGFLKLLRGSGLRKNAKELGIVYKDKAPYDVLYTDELNYEQMLKLKMIEDIFEIYHNGQKFKSILEYAVDTFDTPFDFYESLATHWENNDLHCVSHNKFELFNILFDYLITIDGLNIDLVKDLLKFDMFLNENVKNMPNWAHKTDYTENKKRIDDFYSSEENSERFFSSLTDFSPKQISRMCHIEQFQFDFLMFLKTKKLIKRKTFVLFNYYERDCLTGNAKYYKIEL